MAGPLASLKILDFTTLLPGPYATMILADLGAEVVRVEAPNRPDLMRISPPYDEQGSVGHALVNRSKRSLALDLKHPEAPELIKTLVKAYDVVVEGFRPGVMDRLRIGYEALAAVQPRLIYCAITGFGQTGPYRDRAGHDINYLALSGLMSHTGRELDGPVLLGMQLADVGGGSLGAVVGILAAVIHRQQTGDGQFVDLSMLDATIALNALSASHFLAANETPAREEDPLNGGSFYDYYQTSDGRFLAVGSLEPKFWTGFCKVIGRPDLINQGYNMWDREVQQRLKREIQNVIASRPLEAWIDTFSECDVCVEPVLDIEEMAAHPQVAARNMIVDVPRSEGQPQRQVGSPFRFSANTATYHHVGAELGEHTTDILIEVGYTPERIQTLRENGAFGETPG